MRSQLRSPRSSDPESESDPAAEAAAEAAILGETGFNIHPGGTRGLAAFQQQRGGGSVHVQASLFVVCQQLKLLH